MRFWITKRDGRRTQKVTVHGTSTGRAHVGDGVMEITVAFYYGSVGESAHVQMTEEQARVLIEQLRDNLPPEPYEYREVTEND